MMNIMYLIKLSQKGYEQNCATKEVKKNLCLETISQMVYELITEISYQYILLLFRL